MARKVQEMIDSQEDNPLSECAICGEYHPATESCLEAWFHGLKSSENDSKKSPNFRENEDQPVGGRYPAKIAVND